MATHTHTHTHSHVARQINIHTHTHTHRAISSKTKHYGMAKIRARDTELRQRERAVNIAGIKRETL